MMDTKLLCEESRKFGQRVLLARRKLGMTQPALAAQTGLNAATIRRIEQGGHNPHQSTVLSLAQSLQVSAHQLYGSEEASSTPPLLTPMLARLMQVCAAWPEDLQQAALTFALVLDRYVAVSDQARLTTPPGDHSNSPSAPPLADH